jgi:hypothetical protein
LTVAFDCMGLISLFLLTPELPRPACGAQRAAPGHGLPGPVGPNPGVVPRRFDSRRPSSAGLHGVIFRISPHPLRCSSCEWTVAWGCSTEFRRCPLHGVVPRNSGQPLCMGLFHGIPRQPLCMGLFHGIPGRPLCMGLFRGSSSRSPGARLHGVIFRISPNPSAAPRLRSPLHRVVPRFPRLSRHHRSRQTKQAGPARDPPPASTLRRVCPAVQPILSCGR